MVDCGGFANRGEPCQTVAVHPPHEPNRGVAVWFVGRTEPWHRSVVRGANRTVGVVYGLVCWQTAPHGSQFEPWSTVLTVALRPLSILPCFHEHAVCKKIAFSHPLCIHPLTLTLPPILVFDHIFPVFAHS